MYTPLRAIELRGVSKKILTPPAHLNKSRVRTLKPVIKSDKPTKLKDTKMKNKSVNDNRQLPSENNSIVDDSVTSSQPVTVDNQNSDGDQNSDCKDDSKSEVDSSDPVVKEKDNNTLLELMKYRRKPSCITNEGSMKPDIDDSECKTINFNSNGSENNLRKSVVENEANVNDMKDNMQSEFEATVSSGDVLTGENIESCLGEAWNSLKHLTDEVLLDDWEFTQDLQLSVSSKISHPATPSTPSTVVINMDELANSERHSSEELGDLSLQAEIDLLLCNALTDISSSIPMFCSTTKIHKQIKNDKSVDFFPAKTKKNLSSHVSVKDQFSVLDNRLGTSPSAMKLEKGNANAITTPAQINFNSSNHENASFQNEKSVTSVFSSPKKSSTLISSSSLCKPPEIMTILDIRNLSSPCNGSHTNPFNKVLGSSGNISKSGVDCDHTETKAKSVISTSAGRGSLPVTLLPKTGSASTFDNLDLALSKCDSVNQPSEKQQMANSSTSGGSLCSNVQFSDIQRTSPHQSTACDILQSKAVCSSQTQMPVPACVLNMDEMEMIYSSPAAGSHCEPSSDSKSNTLKQYSTLKPMLDSSASSLSEMKPSEKTVTKHTSIKQPPTFTSKTAETNSNISSDCVNTVHDTQQTSGSDNDLDKNITFTKHIEENVSLSTGVDKPNKSSVLMSQDQHPNENPAPASMKLKETILSSKKVNKDPTPTKRLSVPGWFGKGLGIKKKRK